MHSLAQEIRSFSRANLRKQRTRVTTLTGRRIIETWRGACLQVEEEEAEAEAAPGGGGYVQDLSADLQVGVVKPWLLLGSQDAAHDLETMKKYKVT
ncbi:DUS19 phosphatase, partial [Mesembrinibis cayennensis]|nr:DUS19 phosphatase [Mesembrinibis cayennensis]